MNENLEPSRHKKYKANKSTRTHVTKEHNNRDTNNTLIKQEMCHIVTLPFTLKSYLTTKEELWKLKYFTVQK
jgi:hypothetical protein